jgi:hypothetical protein
MPANFLTTVPYLIFLAFKPELQSGVAFTREIILSIKKVSENLCKPRQKVQQPDHWNKYELCGVV